MRHLVTTPVSRLPWHDRLSARKIIMQRLLLFSNVTEEAQQKVFPLLFPREMPRKVFACMPSEGSLRGRSYEMFCDSWQTIARSYNAEFLYIDNSRERAHSTAEQAKLISANILLITGGNTCALLRNLRRSGLDQSILDFAHKHEFVIGGYSAGAIVLTPTVQIAATKPWPNENQGVGLTNFDALHFVDFEVFPHYAPDTKAIFERYRKVTANTLKPLADDEYICIDDYRL